VTLLKKEKVLDYMDGSYGLDLKFFLEQLNTSSSQWNKQFGFAYMMWSFSPRHADRKIQS